MGCTVVETSGDIMLDDAACERALTAHFPNRKTGLSLRADSKGRFTSCAPNAGQAGSEFRAKCSVTLETMRKARAMTPRGQASWLSALSSDELFQQARNGSIRIGINEQGQPTYCLTMHVETASLRVKICEQVMRKARFDPARNQEGEPVPSVYNSRLF
jgi:hypothetical protein